MAPGTAHLIVGGILAFALFSGAVLVDLDHLRTHNLRQLWNGFIGKEYVHSERDDSHHFFHSPTGYRLVFLITGFMVLFSIGLYIHLKMDGVL